MEGAIAQLTLREGRAAYFDANHLGADGGYGLKWVPVKVGPIPILIPNSAARVRSLQLHDLHHVLTGYATDWLGETEIGCWEIGSGCRDHFVAWGINLAVMVLGSLTAPRMAFRAFARGRRARNLYGRSFDEALLNRHIGEVRAELGLDVEPDHARAADLILFGVWYAVGLLEYAAPLVLLGGAWAARRWL